MAELKEAHFEVIDKNKAETHNKKKADELYEAQDIYNKSKGLQNISEHDLRKFNTLMKYIPWWVKLT